MPRLPLILALLPSAIAAQQPVMIPLKAANGTLSDPLAVGQVRELRDGRLIVAGQGGVVIADIAKGSIKTIPNVPRGALVPLAADSTLVVAPHTGWVFLDAERVLGMLPLSNPVVTAAESELPISADQFGHVLSTSGGWPDSASGILIDRSTNERQLVAHLWRGEPAHGGMPAPVFIVTEQAVLALDGWIAVVRAHPYRVDWRLPTGEWLRGAPLPIPPMPMDKREQAAYLAYYHQRPDSPYQPPTWPPFVEPFTYPMPIATPDGKVLVRRWPSADLPGTRYDVVNRRGELEGQIALPGSHAQIAGFGAKSIYLITVPDSTDPRRVQLERRPWP